MTASINKNKTIFKVINILFSCWNRIQYKINITKILHRNNYRKKYFKAYLYINN